MSIAKGLTKNSLYNLIGGISPLFITIFTVPVYIERVGEARYGILALVWLTLGYFGLFDFGLGKAVANRVALYRKDFGVKTTIFWSALQISLFLGFIGSLLLYFSIPFIILYVSDINNEILKEIDGGIFWLCLSFPVLTVTSVATGYLEGEELFKSLNALQVIRDILLQLLPLFTVYLFGSNLSTLILAAVFARISSTALILIYIKGKSFLGRYEIMQKEVVKALISFGGAVTISNIIGPILTSIDRFVIGSLGGASAVSYYTVPYNLTTKINIIPLSISRTLFPQFSMLDRPHAMQLGIPSIKFILVIITPIIIGGILLIDPILEIWISKDFASNSGTVGQIILIGVWCGSTALVPFAFLRGQGNPRIVAMCHLFEFVPYLLILWFCVSNWGIEGAAAAWVARVAVDAVLLYYFSKFDNKLYFTIFTHFLVVIVSFLLFRFFEPVSYYIIGLVLIGYFVYIFKTYYQKLRSLFIS